MQFPVFIGLHRSRFLEVLLVIATVCSECLIVIQPLWPFAIRITSFFVVLVVAYLAWRSLEPGYLSLRLDRSGAMSIQPPGEEQFVVVKLLPGAAVHPWLTVFSIEIPGNGNSRLLVTVDSLSEDDFRRLRMFLKWRAKFGSAVSDV